MVAEQFVVGAEGEIQLTVARFQLLEYLSVKLFIGGDLLSYVVALVCQMPLDCGNNVAHRVHAPYNTVVEKGATKGIVAARAAAEDEAGLFVGYYLLQLSVYLLWGEVVIVESRGDESGVREHVL